MMSFIRSSSSPSDKYGEILYYYDQNSFVRQSTAYNDKYGSILYYVDAAGFIRQSNGPSDKYGAIVYYIDNDGFVRQSNGPSDTHGAIVYYIDNDGFVRESNGPSDKYGKIVYFIEKENPPAENKGGILLALAFVIALIFAPIIIVLGMYGKFLMGGLFKKVLVVDEFKKFRKTYSIISLSWQVLGIVAIVLFAVFEIAVEIALYALVGVNILLLVLSVVIGNKIYNKHKDELAPLQSVENGPVNDIAELPVETIAVEESAKSGDIAEVDAMSTSDDKAESTIAHDTFESIEILKKLKELLDLGIITKAEFNKKKADLLFGSSPSPQKKKSVKNDGKTQNLIFKFSILSQIIALVTFIVGAVFLIFEYVPSDWVYDYENLKYISYFEYAFVGGVAALLTIIFGFTYLICCIIQTIFSLQKNKHTTFMLILGIFATLCVATTIVFAFISYYDLSLIYGILASVSAGFTLIQLALTILLMCKKLSSKQ